MATTMKAPKTTRRKTSRATKKKAHITHAYDKARKTLQTGDIVLFSGKGMVSEGIKRFTFSKWSHVGMVIYSKEFETVLLWESTTLSNIKDIDSGEHRKGVQIVPLSQRIASYNGEIAIRKLDVERTDEMKKKLIKLRNDVRGRPYEKDEIQLIKSAYDGPFGRNTEDLSSLFCSELVAEAYQAMGLLEEVTKRNGSKPSNEYTPADFSYKKRESLDLLNGAKLGREIIVKK